MTPYTALFFAIALVLMLSKDIRLSIALMAGSLGMILRGVLTIDALEWRKVFSAYRPGPLGIVVGQTNTAAWIFQEVLAMLGSVQLIVIMSLVAVLATLFSPIMSNVGETVLLVPLAIAMAEGVEGSAVGADPRRFTSVVALGTSNSFPIPTHQANALIMGLRGYSNADYIRDGEMMTVLSC